MGHEQAVHTVTFDSSSHEVNCSCQLFEFAGYLCRHVLKIYFVEDVLSFPPQYILKRWIRSAKSGPVFDPQGGNIQVDCHQPTTLRYSKLCQEAINIAAMSCVDNKIYKLVMHGFHKILREGEGALKLTSICSNGGASTRKKYSNTPRVGNPRVLKHIGSPKKTKAMICKPLTRKRKDSKQTLNVRLRYVLDLHL